MPCDTGGLEACHYLRTHGYSPGAPVHPEDLFAWEVFWQAQKVGWEAVRILRKLDTLDAYEADWLLTRLVILTEYVQAQQQAMRDER